MKKTLLLIVVAVLSTGLYAQSIKLKSGSLGFLKDETAIQIEFTYENTKVGKVSEDEYIKKRIHDYNAKEAGKGDAWLLAWNNDKENTFPPKFIELFDKHLEGKNLESAYEANYKMIVNADYIEHGYNVGVSRRNASVNLTVTFVSNETNKEVAVVTIINASANNFWGTDFDSAYRVQECYGKAGRELAKFLIKHRK